MTLSTRSRTSGAAIMAAIIGALVATAVVVVGADPVAAAGPAYTYTVSAPLVVPDDPSDVAVDPTTHLAYVINGLGKTVTVVDTTTNTKVDTIATDVYPSAAAIDPGLRRLYVLVGYDKIDVIDLATNAVTDRIADHESADIAVDPVTHDIYTANNYSADVSVIDPATRTETAVIDVQSYPVTLAIDPATHSLFTTDPDGDSVFVIDTTANTVSRTITVGASPTAIAVDTATHTLFVANADDRTVSIVDETGAGRATTVPIGQFGFGEIGVDATTSTAYVVSHTAGTVVVIDETTRSVTDTLSVGPMPQNVAVDPIRHIAVVANRDNYPDPANTGTGQVSIIAQRPASSTSQPDRSTVGYQGTPVSSLSTGPVSTSGPGELLVALVQADGPATGVQRVTSLGGGGLRWTRAVAANTPGQGASEVWQAFAPSRLTNARVTAKLARAADAAIVVRSYTGAAPTLGASSAATSTHGPAARLDVTPQAAGSLVVAGGLDWSSPIRPVPAAGQTLAHYFADRRVGDEYWTQAVTAPTGTGTPVSVSAKIPAGSRWSFAAVEVEPAIGS